MFYAISTGMTIIGILVILNILKSRFPIYKITQYSSNDLPLLRKLYAIKMIIMIVINLLIFIGTVFLMLWVYSEFNMLSWHIVALPCFVLGIFPWFEFKLLLHGKNDEYKNGFRAFLNLSYGIDYFKALKFFSAILIVAGIVFFILGIFQGNMPFHSRT